MKLQFLKLGASRYGSYPIERLYRTFTAAIVLAFAASPAVAAIYDVVDLGTLAGSSSELRTESHARAINASGQVVGESNTALDDSHAFIWQGGVMTDLGTLSGGTFSNASAINNAGFVVGGSDTSSGDQHAFVYDGTTMRDLGTLGGAASDAKGINNSLQIVGESEFDPDFISFDEHAFLFQYDNVSHTVTSRTDLGTLGGPSSGARGINDAGQVVGEADVDDVPIDHAFIWQSAGGMKDLGTLLDPSEPNTSSADAINASGVAVGESDLNGPDTDDAAVSFDSGVTDLGTLFGDENFAHAINGLGVIVGGTDSLDDDNDRAFIWDSANKIQDLNDLIDVNSGWVLRAAYGINNSGWIVGVGDLTMLVDGEPTLFTDQAFLLRPHVASVPEPGSLLLLLIAGLCGVVVTWRRKEIQIA